MSGQGECFRSVQVGDVVFDLIGSDQKSRGKVELRGIEIWAV